MATNITEFFRESMSPYLTKFKSVFAQKDSNNTFTKSQTGAVATLTYGANVAIDSSLSNNFVLTLTGDATLDNMTNKISGTTGIIEVIQDATGGHTLSYGDNYATTPTINTTAGKSTLVSYYIANTKVFLTALEEV